MAELTLAQRLKVHAITMEDSDTITIRGKYAARVIVDALEFKEQAMPANLAMQRTKRAERNMVIVFCANMLCFAVWLALHFI